MIASKRFQPTMLNENRQKRIETAPYNEDEIIICDREISVFASPIRRFIKAVETTFFSTNQSVLLKKLRCGRLFEGNGQFQNLKKILSTRINISESSNSQGSSDETAIYSGMAAFQSGSGTDILLEKPILIKYGFKYEIRMEQSPPEECYSGALLKSEVSVTSGFKIRFYDDVPKDDYVSRGLIIKLEFIRI